MTEPDGRSAEGRGGLNRAHTTQHPARPAWIKAWAVLAALACVWVAAMLLTPEHCNILSRCDWYSDIGIGIIGAPIILVALLLALILSAVAWWRKA